jgi:hypothetical protein
VEFKIFKKRDLPVPNLIILGAQKSGTTSLYYSLAFHPSIFMSFPEKEPRYYTDIEYIRNYWRKRGRTIPSKKYLLSKYMLKGYKNQKYFGDSSTDYTIGDLSIKFNIPKTMLETNHEMKFLYIIRNPFERIISNYLHNLNKGYTTVEFNKEIRENPRYILTSQYYTQLLMYLRYFPKEHFMVIIFEEFIKDQTKALKEIFDFLHTTDDSHRIPYIMRNPTANNELYDNSLRYSHSNYVFLRDLFYREKTAMENFINRPIDLWNLSEDTWCKPDA